MAKPKVSNERRRSRDSAQGSNHRCNAEPTLASSIKGLLLLSLLPINAPPAAPTVSPMMRVGLTTAQLASRELPRIERRRVAFFIIPTVIKDQLFWAAPRRARLSTATHSSLPARCLWRGRPLPQRRTRTLSITGLNCTRRAAAPVSTTTGAATPAPGGGPGLVWVNTTTHIYHKEGSRFYGKTKKGKHVSEADAIKEGDRAAAKGH
jgi:hypothetical protein